LTKEQYLDKIYAQCSISRISTGGKATFGSVS